MMKQKKDDLVCDHVTGATALVDMVQDGVEDLAGLLEPGKNAVLAVPQDGEGPPPSHRTPPPTRTTMESSPATSPSSSGRRPTGSSSAAAEG